MTVPTTNQIFLGGRFHDILTMGDLEMTSIESNNVYLGYLKDDTFLYESSVVMEDQNIYPNPFSTTFMVKGINDIDIIEIFNVSGALIESYNHVLLSESLGSHLKTGIYYIKLKTKAGHIHIQKVVKIH